MSAYVASNSSCVNVGQGSCLTAPPPYPGPKSCNQGVTGAPEKLICSDLVSGFDSARFASILAGPPPLGWTNDSFAELMAIAHGYRDGYAGCAHYITAYVGAGPWTVKTYNTFWGCKIMFGGPAADAGTRLTSIQNDLNTFLDLRRKSMVCAAGTLADPDINGFCMDPGSVLPFYTCADLDPVTNAAARAEMGCT